MTAVLSASDVLRKDRHMSLDDNGIGFSTNTDWREKYNEVVDMLAETRAELDDFHQASKELEAELESELARTEKSQHDLQAKVVRAEEDREQWKTKFMSLQTQSNITIASLQKDLDQLRQEHQKTKVYLRELEMGNDDLERNERAVSSSLADMESKYTKALEEKILLEHELVEKAGIEEESQRLKDELRDANVEISILKDQISTLNLRQPSEDRSAAPSLENLLQTVPPPGLEQGDVSPSEPPTNEATTPKASARPTGPYGARALVQPDRPSPITALRTTTNLIRSSTVPSLSSPSAIPSPRALVRPSAARNPASTTSATSTGSLAKNKGVQMVSEMRARVRNLEQKIHTRVPRLRMASITGRQNMGSITPISSSSSINSNTSTAKTSWESQRKSADSRRSNDSGSDKTPNRDGGDSSGWVLIMEDSPSPQKNKEVKQVKDKRRVSNPGAPTAFRPSATIRAPSPSLSTGVIRTGPNPLAASMGTGLRRPQSRLSSGGGSGSGTSRPQTPTFLPVPSPYTPASTAGLKRSTANNALSSMQMKRSSLGKGNNATPPVPPLPTAHRARPITMPPLGYDRSSASGPSSPTDVKALPSLPSDLHANVTMRSGARVTSSISSSSVLSKSRIGRPSGGGISGRTSRGDDALDIADLRPRSSSSSTAG